MRYFNSLLLLGLLSCLGCGGCGGQLRFLFGIFTQGKTWSTTTGWTMGMVSTGVVGIALVGLIGVFVYFNTANVDEVTSPEKQPTTPIR